MTGAPVAGSSGRRAFRAAALVLLAVHTWLVVAAMAAVDRTADETTYLLAGSVLRRAGWEHEITRLHGPVPFLANQMALGDVPPEALVHGTVRPEVVFRGRLGMLPFTWLAFGVVLLWSRRAFGRRGALLSLGAYALNPITVGYAALVAVDTAHAAASILALYLLWRFAGRPSARRALALGLALGLALATKYLALLLAAYALAYACLAALLRTPVKGGRAVLRASSLGLAIGLAALAGLWIAYGLRAGGAAADPELYRSDLVRSMPDVPVARELLGLLPAPFVRGVDFQLAVGGAEHTPYLNGRFAEGHWNYYLWALFLKTPEWLLAAFLWFAARRLPAALRSRAPAGERTSFAVLVPAGLALLLYLSLGTSLQIGLRYVLPLYPMLFVALGALAHEPVVARLRGRGLAAVSGVLLLLAARDLAVQWPNLIGYYNALSGGPARAYRHFADSNSDWGQRRRSGLRELEATESEPFEVLRAAEGPRFGRLAIDLRDLVRKDPEDASRAHHWLLALEPVRHVGASWYLYDVTPEAYETALAGGGEPRTRAELALAYLGADRWEEAVRHLGGLPEERAAPLRRLLERAAAAAAPGADAETLVSGAAAWMDADRPDRTVELLEGPAGRALAGEPARDLLLARALVRRGELEAAARALEASLDRASPAALLLLAEVRRRLGLWDEATLLLRSRSAELAPEWRERARAFLREIERQRDQHEALLELLDRRRGG